MDVIRLYTVKGSKVAQPLPFFLPQGKSGKLSVTTQVRQEGERCTVRSMRNAIYMGMDARPAFLELEQDTRFHYLKDEDHGTWMTTELQEVEQSHRQVQRFTGRVLVGGLGLGLAPAILALNPDVDEVTVVERSPNIIKLVEPYLGWTPKIHVVQADLFQFLPQAQKLGLKWDYAFYDIWQPTSERMIREYTLPLRQASLGLVAQENIEQWNEAEMLGQVAQQFGWMFGKKIQALQNVIRQERAQHLINMPADRIHGFLKADAAGPYWNKVRHVGYETPGEDDDYLKALKDADDYNRDWKQWEV